MIGFISDSAIKEKPASDSIIRAGVKKKLKRDYYAIRLKG